VEEEFLPEEISGTSFYAPNQNQRENAIKEFLKTRWKNKYDF
jgi:putative ATPase